MAITIKDAANADVDYVRESFVLEDAANQRGKLQFQHIGTSPPLEWGETVYVYDGATKIWGGTVDGVAETDITVGDTTTLRFSYSCVDFSQLTGRIIRAASFSSQTAGQIVADLADDVQFTGLGLSAGTIESGPLIASITFNYLPYEMMFDELAEISGFQWTINKDKQIDFRAVDSNYAPFDLTDSNRPYRNITFSESKSNYTNEVWVRAGTQLESSDTVEIQKGDGSKRVFVVGAPIGNTPTVEINTGGGYVSQTVGVNGIGTGSDWYYNAGSPIIVQDAGGGTLSATDTIRITFKARYPIIVFAANDKEIAARAAVEGGSGKYQRVIDATDVDTAEQAQLKATSILQQYGAARLEVNYTTDTSGLEAGMSQLINLTEHGINARFLIERVTLTLLEDGTTRYSVTGAATQTVAGWSYWKQKTRQDRKFVTRDNEILNELRTPLDNVTVADSESTQTYAGAYTVNGADTYINGFHVG